MRQRDISGDRRRLLFLTPTLGKGGAERQLLRLANGLDVRKFDITVACLRAGGEYETELIPGRSLVHLTRCLRSSTFAGLVSEIRVRRLLRTLRPQLCMGLLNQTCAILAGLSRGKCGRLILGVQSNIGAELGGLATWRRRILRWRLQRGFEAADGIVAISKGVAADLANRFPVGREKIKVIYNAGFDDATLSMREEPLPETGLPRPLLVACGRLTLQKDYATLLRALVRLREKVPAHLWILGDGPERHTLQLLTEALGLTSAVRFLGFRRNPYAVMGRADAFVLSSRWEGFANVLVEAMAVGAPVVATDCPFGPSEIIEPERSGLLIPPGEVEPLAAALERVLTERGLAARLREAGKLRAQEFSAAKSVAGYESVIDGIFGQEPGLI